MGGPEGGSNQSMKRDPRGQRAWPGELRDMEGREVPGGQRGNQRAEGDLRG